MSRSGDPDRPAASSSPSETRVPGAPSDRDSAELPSELGPYPILAELGRGGMGIVYLGQDPRLGRRVAIKTLPAAVSAHPLRLARFQREARLLASLNHPNVATIYSLEQHDSLALLTMEVVDGETLSQHRRRRDVPLLEALLIGADVARALAAAHAQGVVHRDLKPGNVMVARDGRVKVLDFGLATSLVDDEPDLTVSGAAVGTAGYMSPEQARGDAIDERTDLWALGCLLFELLAGRAAFPGRGAAQRTTAVVSGPIELVRLPSGTPERVRRLIERCLTRDLDQRLASAAEAERELDATSEAHARAISTSDTGRVSRPGNLPPVGDSFIGREPKVAEVLRQLDRSRLVSVIGFGGCGKTRLAIEVASRLADRMPNGCWFVDLAAIHEPERVAAAVATILDVPERAGLDRLAGLTDALSRRSALLVLDNCEHLAAAVAALVRALLDGCPTVRLLTTSREPLGVDGESRVELPPLLVPGTGTPASAALWEIESVRLFVDRARRAEPEFQVGESELEAIARICQHVDGIPLALELSAARLRVLSLDELERRLADRFAVIRGGRDRTERHRTLSGLIDWSHEQLEAHEQRLFRRLAVFAGGFTIDALVAVCADDPDDDVTSIDELTSLLDKSLVVRDSGDGTSERRFRLLETLREYAAIRLDEADEVGATRARHRLYLVDLAERAAIGQFGPNQTSWLARLDRERANLRVALTGLQGSDVELGLRLAGALGRWWLARGNYSEGRSLLEPLLERPEAQARTAQRALALTQLGGLVHRQAEFRRAEVLVDEAVAIWQEVGDPSGQAMALSLRGHIAQSRNEFDRAFAIYSECLQLRRLAGDEWGIAVSTSNLGTVCFKRNELERSIAYQEEALAMHRRRGDRLMMAMGLVNLGIVYEASNELERAREALEQAIVLQREVGERWGEANALDALGQVLLQLGEHAAARAAIRAAIEMFREQHELWGLSATIDTAAYATRNASPLRAVRLHGAADALRRERELGLPSGEQEQLDVALAALREQLGAKRFDAAWQTGGVLGIERAADDALAALSEDGTP